MVLLLEQASWNKSVDDVSKGSGKVTIYVSSSFSMSMHITSDTIPFLTFSKVMSLMMIQSLFQIMIRMRLTALEARVPLVLKLAALDDAFATNHKDVCDVFQAALSGVKDQNGDSVVQNFVDDNIPSFPLEKTGHLMDVYEVAREAMISELQYSAAYHNASLVRDVCANIFKSWDFDSLCDSVATLIASEGLRDIYKNECMISQYLKMEGNRGQTCVLGTHHNTEIHRLERLVTENGLDCIVYRILLVIQGCLRPEMFPSSEVLTLDFMTIEDDRTLQHTSMSVWDLFNPETDLTKLPSTLTNTYVSMHEGEPLACAIRGCQDFKDFSFDAVDYCASRNVSYYHDVYDSSPLSDPWHFG